MKCAENWVWTFSRVYEKHIRKLSRSNVFRTKGNLPEHSGAGWRQGRAAGGRTYFCLQHMDTGLGPHHQTLLNLVVLWCLSASYMRLEPLFPPEIFVFFQFLHPSCVRNMIIVKGWTFGCCILTCAHSDIFWTFSDEEAGRKNLWKMSGAADLDTCVLTYSQSGKFTGKWEDN